MLLFRRQEMVKILYFLHGEFICGEIFSNEALHFDVCRPYQKESMTFNNMGKDIKGMESPVSYKQRDTGWRRVVSVYKGT